MMQKDPLKRANLAAIKKKIFSIMEKYGSLKKDIYSNKEEEKGTQNYNCEIENIKCLHQPNASNLLEEKNSHNLESTESFQKNIIKCYANGDKYDGEWGDDKKNGHGIYYYASGAKYDGEQEDGQENGHGIYYHSDGRKYDGEWEDGQENGYGILYDANGNKIWEKQ